MDKIKGIFSSHDLTRTSSHGSAPAVVDASRVRADAPPVITSRAVDFDAPSVVLTQDHIDGSVEGYVGVDWEQPRQVMEGMGFSITWYGNWLVAHPNAPAILDHVFKDMRPSVVRLRNTFGQGNDQGGVGYQTTKELMEETKTIVDAGRKRLSAKDQFRILLCSWSPPVELKTSNRLHGADTEKGENADEDTLKKNVHGEFVYDQFADYWSDSIKAYEKLGVVPTWISIQNEPDWNTKYHPVCIFSPSEDFFKAGYYKAFDVVYDKLHKEMKRVPQMLGPESTGFDNFVTPPVNGASGFQVHPYSGNPRVAGICNHLYDAGVTYDNSDFFSKLDVTLRNARKEADQTMTRRLMMTEYASLRNHKPGDPILLARTIYETLTVGEACMYLQWDGVWGRSNEGTLIVLDNPFEEIDTSKTWGFERTQSYFWWLHFCRFIRPGMQRVRTTDKSVHLKGVLELVFVSKVYDASSTVILVNTTKQWKRVHFGWLPNEIPGKGRKVFYSTLTEEFTYAGLFPASTKFYLKPESITTLHSGDY